MTMRFKLPPGGDVPPAVAARRLGLSLEQFVEVLPDLRRRNPPFPEADPTTGNYDLDAIDAWRQARYPHLFVNTITPQTARNAKNVVRDRLRGVASGG